MLGQTISIMFTTFGYLAAVAGHIISRLVDIVDVLLNANSNDDEDDVDVDNNDHNVSSNNNEKTY